MLLLRSTAEFDDVAACRGFTDEIISRHNARNAKQIDADRTVVRSLPQRPTSDYE